jgi:hypothetical protein
MPPKDNLTISSSTSSLDEDDVSAMQSSTPPSSPTATTTLFFNGNQKRHRSVPFLELEKEGSSSFQNAIDLPPHSFRILPIHHQQQEQQQEVPPFLVLLNQLHGATRPPVVNENDSSVKTEQERHVHFNSQPDEIHSVLSRHDMSTKERDNTWYTEHYLRLMRHAEAADNDDVHGRELSSSSFSHQHHPRELMMAAICIRRGRKLVMKEQARQSYVSGTYPREKRLREAYQRVSSASQKRANERGEAAAKEAAPLYFS